jgi:DNA-binding CsgD family transcriptional regulator
LSRLTSGDDDSTNAAITRLIDLSLLAPSKDSPGGLRAVDPLHAMRVLLQREQEALASIKHNATALDAVATEYAAAGKSAYLDGVERLHHADEVRARVESLADSCRQESLSFHLPRELTEESAQAYRPVSERALARGVHCRSLYSDRSMRDRLTRSHARWMAERDCEVRTTAHLPMGLLIVDTTVAVVRGLSGQGSGAVLVFKSRPVVLAMRALFEAYWHHAQRFPPEAAPQKAVADEITCQERELLELLAEGLTDSAVARIMGMSVRTERRKLAALMERLGVSSRFAAGVQATRRQWI